MAGGDKLTITGLMSEGGPQIDQNRDLEWGGGPRIIILTLTGIHCVLMIPCQNLTGGLQMKHKLTKIGNPPYFGQFGAPPSLFCTRPLYPQGVLKVPVGVNNNLLAPVMPFSDSPPFWHFVQPNTFTQATVISMYFKMSEKGASPLFWHFGPPLEKTSLLGG